MKYATLLLTLCLQGCWYTTSSPNIEHQGYRTETIKKAAVKQEEAVTTINKEATSITDTTKEDTTRKSATIILTETAKIADISEMLNTEAESKADYEKAIVDLEVKNDALIKEKNTLYAKVTAVMKIIGFLLIPTGVILAWKLSGEFIVLSAFGGAMIITSFIVNLLERFGTALAIISIVGIAVAVWYMYFIQRRTAEDAVKVGEAMKQIANKKDSKLVKAVLGDGAIPGYVTQSKASEKQIKQIRKKISK